MNMAFRRVEKGKRNFLRIAHVNFSCAGRRHVSFSEETVKPSGIVAMRRFLAAVLLVCFALPGWSVAMAEPGIAAERVSRASAIDDGMGAVVISIRSEFYLVDPLNVYFLREGGSVENDNDVVRFNRRQGCFAFSNVAVDYQVRAY